MTMTDAMGLFGIFGMMKADAEEKKAGVPEPEFKPFRFPRPEATEVRTNALTPANTAREPRTLEELGVPGPLAKELEATFRLLGHTRGDRVTGFTFRTVDGTAYALKTAPRAGVDAAADDVAA